MSRCLWDTGQSSVPGLGEDSITHFVDVYIYDVKP